MNIFQFIMIIGSIILGIMLVKFTIDLNKSMEEPHKH